MSDFIMKEMPYDERPYEKLMSKGAYALSDTELLAIIIKTGSSGKNAIDLARNLLNDKDLGCGLKGLSSAGIQQIMKHKGIGKVKAIQIKASLELGNRINAVKEDKLKLTNPDQIAYYMMPKAKGLSKEICWILCFDVRMNLVKLSTISIGTLDSSIVHPRDIFNEVIKACAHSFIVVHNHPSGDVNPSENDILLTKRLKKAGILLGMELRDHIIVSELNYFSFLSKSML
ncbi:MAG: DNA repair protein RadC [Clostridia bacterium]|jgi:DNA repair protein RadC